MARTLQKDQPLSRSFIWNLQTKYYQSLGIDAWLSGVVPSRVTTNSYIAWRYARLIASYIRDVRAQRVTILELGAGHGRFGFLTATHLQNIATDFLPPETSWRYILTDCAERNIQFYESHAAFSSLRKEGKADFARYQAGVDQSISLRLSGDTIDATRPVEHLILIGNYFFDSLPMDVWHAENKRLSAYWPIVQIPDSADELSTETPQALEHIKLAWEKREQVLNYTTQAWNSITRQLGDEIQNGTFMVPTGAFECLEQLQSWASQPLTLLVTDKGYLRIDEYRDRGPPTLIQHGCFSFNLNFVALHKWFQSHSGLALLPKCRDGLIEMAAFATHYSRDALPFTISEYSAIEQFTPAEYHQVTRRCENAKPDLFTALSYLKLSCYDPLTLHRLRRSIRAGIPNADLIEQKLLYDALSQVRQKFYHLQDFDIPFDLALIYQHLGEYEIALELFHESLQLFGESGITYYNLAICHQKLGQNGKAVENIEKSIALDATDDSLDFHRKLRYSNMPKN